MTDRSDPKAIRQPRRLVGDEDRGRWSVGPDKALEGHDIDDWRERVDRAYKRLSRVPEDRMMWMTIIGAALVVTPGDHSFEIEKAIADLERKLRARCRRKLPRMRIRGVHEVDVVAPTTGLLGAYKTQTISGLGIDLGAVRGDERVLLVHLHCLIDHGPYTAAVVIDELRAEYPGSRRIMGKPLDQARSPAENVERLASYSSKLKVAYCQTWDGRGTKFGEIYEDVWLDTIIQTISGVGLDRLLFCHGDVS